MFTHTYILRLLRIKGDDGRPIHSYCCSCSKKSLRVLCHLIFVMITPWRSPRHNLDPAVRDQLSAPLCMPLLASGHFSPLLASPLELLINRLFGAAPAPHQSQSDALTAQRRRAMTNRYIPQALERQNLRRKPVIRAVRSFQSPVQRLAYQIHL